MSTAYEIPLIAGPQTFEITLAGVTYNFTIKWNVYANVWVLDIADSNGGNIIDGLPLLVGQDLLAPYGYLGIGGQLVVQSDFDAYAQPTSDNLGSTSHLYFVVQ